MAELRGRIALITGAGRGLGRAIAVAIAGAGAEVALCARSGGELEAVAAICREASGRALVLPGDLADPDFRRHLVAEVGVRLGAVDILVNNAGIAPSAPLERSDDELWERTFALNVEAPFQLSRLVMRGMAERGYGRIVNVASTAALKGYPYTSAYVASKHALLGLTRALGRELASRGVTVNAVCPGFADTRIASEAIENIVRKTGRSPEEARGFLVTENPLGRLIRPEEVAEAVMAFLGPDSAALSGQALAVAGGAVEG
ncbi:MAG: SDR family NAD(P)-dependent oxidoreductase [Planctomycetes bacterium]|nr:SDR family NAD(P)-dependent oxidoreductase [Planctomycetota bacterium]